MASVLKTIASLTKLQVKNRSTSSLLCSVRFISADCSISRSAPHSRTAIAPAFIIQKRTITNDSWGAEGLIEQGQKLESIDHKQCIIVGDEYMEGPPPAEVTRICNEILKLNIVDIQILVKLVTTRLGYTDETLFGGISASGGGGGGGGNEVQAVVAEPVKEKEVFDIKLTVVDPKSKIKIIKEVRALTGLGLKEAKDLVEKAPVVIKEGIKKEEIEAIKKILTDAGAQFEVL